MKISIGTGIVVAGMWIGVGIACFATPYDAFVGFYCALIATIVIAASHS